MIQYDTSDKKIVTLLIEARAVNPLSRLFQRALAVTLERLETEAHRLEGVIIGFNDGAPQALHELEQLIGLSEEQSADCMAMLAAYHVLLRRMEQLSCPVIAALAGDSHGHALALALACQRRYALDGACFSMPQITFGMLPSGGAIVRLVRRIGVPAALPWLLDGAPRSAAEALRDGLLDATAANDTALAALVQAALRADGAVPPPAPPMADGVETGAPAPGWQHPARDAIWRVATEGARAGFDDALHMESSHFCRIAIGQEAKHLMRLHADAMRGSERHRALR